MPHVIRCSTHTELILTEKFAKTLCMKKPALCISISTTNSRRALIHTEEKFIQQKKEQLTKGACMQKQLFNQVPKINLKSVFG